MKGYKFWCNINSLLQEDVSATLGVYNPLDIGKYLGMPSLIGRSKKAVFDLLKTRVW